jgi:hypothetical protein
MNPEGDFLEYTPPAEKQENQTLSSRVYCKFCGVEIQDLDMEKCPNCGTSRTV